MFWILNILTTLYICSSAEDKKGVTFKWMPKRPVKVLRNTLERLYAEICMDMNGSPGSATTAADNTVDTSDNAEAEAIDLDFAKHRKEVRKYDLLWK